MYDYSISQLYTTSFSYDYKYAEDSDFFTSRFYNDSLNPIINFTLEISNDGPDFKVNQSNFGVIYYNEIEKKLIDIQINEIFQTSIYSLRFFLYYKCKIDIDGNCTISDEDKPDTNIFFLNFDYLGFKLDQNEESPIKRENRFNQYIFSLNDKIPIYSLKWKNIIYKEEKGGITGMFSNLKGENNNKYGGEFLDPITTTINEEDLPNYLKYYKYEGKKHLSLIFINPYDPGNYYDIYSGKKKYICFNSKYMFFIFDII